LNTRAIANVARIPELNRRILYTLGMLAVYRVGCAIPTPGVDPAQIRRFFEDGGGVFGLFNLFTGGALEQLSIFALGIMPYITASIILQLMGVVIPHLAELRKEGEEGRRTITRYTRYLTIGLSIIQGMFIAVALEGGLFGPQTVIEPGWGFRVMAVITLTAGTAFIMWLGEQITERGIGNGISLIIFAGIVTSLPGAISNIYDLVRTDQITLMGVALLLAVMIGVIGVIVYFERAQRRIPIQYARRVVGRQVFGGGMAYFPMRLNVSGVIPPIFATSLMLLPVQLSGWIQNATISDFMNDFLSPSSMVYNAAYVILIVFFAFFYSGVLINPDDVADNIKRNGGYIPGIRPGQRTAHYINRVMNRITSIGAVYLAAVCVLPVFLSNQFGVPFYFGGTALLIVVGVAMDTVGQVEAHLVSRNYEAFARGGRIAGRRGR
jgi:preprotein translocase subunit SecY